jgi:phosphinothricin acetyltransferase
MTALLEIDDTIVSPCVPTDIAAIAAIYAHAVAYGSASFELEPPSPVEMLARCEGLMTAGYPYLVARMGGDIAGYAYVSAYRARPAYAGTVESSVYIRDDLKGRGLGRTLMRALIHEAEALGYRQMIANVGDSANLASIRLHESLGFRIAGTLISVGWKHGRWLDTVLMQRPLGPGERLSR